MTISQIKPKPQPRQIFHNLLCSSLMIFAVSPAEAAELKISDVEFIVNTNVRLFSYTGKADGVRTVYEGDGQRLRKLEIIIPVEGLHSALELRDKHMRDQIFTRSDGARPNLEFVAHEQNCDRKPEAGVQCTLQGQLSIRGEPRPLSLAVQFLDAQNFKGQGKIKLADYGIAAPSHAGITVSEDVAIAFEGRIP